MKHLFFCLSLLVVMVVSALSQSEVPPVFAPDDSLPVVGSVMLDPSDQPVTFHSSAASSSIAQITLTPASTSRCLPPGVGVTTTCTFGGDASFTVAVDSGGGTTTGTYRGTFTILISLRLVHDSGGVQDYQTEVLEMSLSGGSLPGGVRVRESPSKASLGRLRERHNLGSSGQDGVAISSFFDIFTELSLDGGATWTPADNSVRLETKSAPTFVPDVAGDYACPQGISIGDLDGDGAPDLVLSNHVPSPPSPPVGSSIVHSFTCDASLLYDGIQRTVPSCACSVRLTHTYDDASSENFDVELLQMDVSGGTLPGNVRLRESPTKASLGKTTVRQMGGGQYSISSFFDIFTEISLDGGQTWTPRQAPATLSYVDTLHGPPPPASACLPVATYPNDLYPPDGMLASPPSPPTTFSNGEQFEWVIVSRPQGSGSQLALPPLGGSQTYDFPVVCDLQRMGGDLLFHDLHLTGTARVSVTHSSDAGEERDFDQELLSLDLTGDAGSAGTVMIRESPSKASLGRHTVAPNGGGFRVSSFFDVFTEVSLDGGIVWSPQSNAMRLEQVLVRPPNHNPAALSSPGSGSWTKSTETCGNGIFSNGAQLSQLSLFSLSSGITLPPSGGSSLTTTDARCRMSLSLDGGASFFDAFLDVTLALQVTVMDSTPGGTFYGLDVLSMTAKDTTVKLRLRESPTLSHLRLRESPTLPSHGILLQSSSVEGTTNTPGCSSFFDIFTELSLDDGQTWSPASSAMRIELDTAAPGSISGMKWHDVNGNGIKDPGETGLANWKIMLSDSLGNIIDTVRTDQSGNYLFPNVASGTYRVLEELSAGWIQTGGSPVYGFVTAPSDSVTGIDFGNFRAPRLSGVIFLDQNGNGTLDAGEVFGKKLYVGNLPYSSSGRVNPGIHVNSSTGSVGMTLAGSPPVVCSVSGYTGARKGWDGTVKGRVFEDGYLPRDLQAIEIHSLDPISIGGQQYAVKGEGKKEYVGHVTLMKRALRASTSSSFFDIFIEWSLTPIIEASTGGMILHSVVALQGDPTLEGSVVRLVGTSDGTPVALLDSNGVQVGQLDSLTLVVGPPASADHPVFTRTDDAGQYSFPTEFPGTWVVVQQNGACVDQTTAAPSPVTVTSGATIPPIDFGIREHGGTICVTKYYDRNHNGQLDPGEPPMSGVQFIVTGTNPANTFSGQTDGSGAICLSSLPPDSYALTENVPHGYAPSNPTSGVLNFTVTSCESTSVVWLNASALSDTSFRTATMLDWALAPKLVKPKPDKVEFQFTVIVPPTATGLDCKFDRVLSGKVERKSVSVVFFNDSKEWLVPAVVPGETVIVSGAGAKGKPVKPLLVWATTPKPTKVKVMVFDLNQPRLPMPNLTNVGTDLTALQAFPFSIGAPSGPKSVVIDQYKTAAKSLNNGKGIMHTGPAVCWSDPKIFKKQLKGLSPVKQSNSLFGEILALALNLHASETGRFPGGLGSLIYDSPPDPADVSSPFFNGETIDSIYQRANSWLTCTTDSVPTGDDFLFVLHRINGAFADSGRVDTTSWSGNNLALKGVRKLSSVEFLRADPSAAQSGAVKGKTLLVMKPTEYALHQNYPNPFNPTTTITFDLPNEAVVTLKVYNIIGQEVMTLLDHEQMSDGNQSAEFNAARLASGVYFYRLVAAPVTDEDGVTLGQAYTSVKKMVLMK